MRHRIQPTPLHLARAQDLNDTADQIILDARDVYHAGDHDIATTMAAIAICMADDATALIHEFNV